MTISTANSVARAPRWRLMNRVADSAVISPRRGAATKLSRVSLAAVVALVGMLSANPAPARALPFNAVTEWNVIAVNTLIGLPGPAGGAPPAAQINVGMVQGAVYDAVNATAPKHHRPYLLKTALRGDGLEGGRCRDRGVRRPLEHRLHRARKHPVPDQGEPCWQSLAHAIRRFARGDTGLAVQGAGDRRGERGGRGDDRRTAGRRPLRALAVGAELRARTLAAARRPDHGAADPRPDPVGRSS